MNSIRMSVNLAAPVARVWEYLTDRDKVAAWLMNSDFVAKVGARFTYSAKPSGTWDGIIFCEVKELIRHERLAFTWNAHDIGAETLVTFQLQEVEGGTRLTLTHDRFAGARPGSRGRHAAGWTRVLKSLRTALCGPDPDYDWSAFQITFFVEAPLASIFAMWSTPEGLKRFWADEVLCQAPAGTVRGPAETFRHGDRVGLVFPTGTSTELEIVNIEQNRFVIFTFGQNYGWVDVRVHEEGDRTRVVLCHFGLPVNGEAPWEVHANARGWWIFHLLNLKSVLLQGRDLRVREKGVAGGLGGLYRPGDTVARPPHDWTCFDVYLYIAAPPADVLSPWLTAMGLESFFVARARFTDASGNRRPPAARIGAHDTYVWRGIHDFQVEGRILEATDGRVRFTFGSRYAVDVTATAHGPGTLLHLHQSGLSGALQDRVDGSLNCRSCWIYFLTNLKCQVEGGKDLRDREPETADSISVGYNA